jgi:perosamine synthetase
MMHVLSKNQLTYGPETQFFERALSAALDSRFVLAVSSGTAALHLILAAMDVGPGDEVLVPDLTYVATANAVVYTGAKPVLVDVDPKTWCMSVEDAQRKLSLRTRAILPVHLYGFAADIRALSAFGIRVVEDAAEGIGGSIGSRALGALGFAGAFSFYGNKILTTGEGGAVVTDNRQLAERMLSLRGHAMSTTRRYFHSEVGFNYRMTEMQAAIGLGQLSHLGEMLASRLAVLRAYGQRLSGYGNLQEALPGTSVAPWLFTMRVHDRDGLANWLWSCNVETRPAFVPLHRMPMFGGRDGDFPNASAIGDSGISLPTFAGLTIPEVDAICERVVVWLRGEEKYAV